MEIGDKVKITVGPPNKVGKIGEVTIVMANGAMVKLSEDKFTPIKFEHLEVMKNEK